MTKIKLNWAYAKGELDTDTLELVCIPGSVCLVLMNWTQNFV